MLLLIELAKHFGFNDIIPPLVLWPIGAGTIYVALYRFFESQFWRNKYINGALKVPDVEGTWQIEGHKLREDGRIELEWSGPMTIVQSWDSIRIHLKTANSESDSISAAIICDKSIGYNLIYTYQNCPEADQTHLAALNI